MLPTLRGACAVLRPVGQGDAARLAEILREPSVARWWKPDPGLTDEPGFVIEVDGAVGGWLTFWEESDPDYRHAAIDLFLSAGAQGRGIGPEAIRLVIGWLIAERGHHRFTIDPAKENERAIRAYASVGFRPVGVLRKFERRPDGRWGDNLLMDLLADELR
jgi:aminoglycoside 6'-N-acetyltransferase